MAKLEGEILSEIELKPYLWLRCIDNIFFLWEYGEDKLHGTHITTKRKFHTAKLFALIESVQILILSIEDEVILEVFNRKGLQ